MTIIISALLGLAGVLAAWYARGRQVKSETEMRMLKEAIDHARRKNKEVRQARKKARRDFNLEGLDDDYKFLRYKEHDK